jgi:hypothetical protein
MSQLRKVVKMKLTKSNLMKNLLIFLLIIFTVELAYSQQYKPFPDSNAAWKESHFFVYGSSFNERIKIHHEIENDTLINAKVYHKITKTGYSELLEGSSTSTTYYNNEYVGAIREDAFRRVFFIKKNHGVEELLYDFNLNIGDTLPEMHGLNIYYDYIVEGIDSVLVAEIYHKTYTIRKNNWLNYFDFIEGVGTTSGLLTKGGFFDDYYSNLDCFKQNGIGAYPSGEECELYIPLQVNNIKQEKISIIPNPTTGILYFDFMENNIQKLNIFDISGKKIIEKSDVQKSETIDLSEYKSGIYIIKVHTDKETFTLKIVKN